MLHFAEMLLHKSSNYGKMLLEDAHLNTMFSQQNHLFCSENRRSFARGNFMLTEVLIPGRFNQADLLNVTEKLRQAPTSGNLVIRYADF